MATSSAAAPLARRWALAAHVYVSEGRNQALVSKLAACGATPGVAVANEFLDAAYHRAGITLTSTDPGRLQAAVLAVCREALRSLDLRSHTATHPRVGVVDHIACNPLGAATCEEAGRLATQLGGALGRGESGSCAAVPVYYYGAAREDARPLAELRRRLGYFGGAAKGEWTGLPAEVAAAMRALAPDAGPEHVEPSVGAAVIGAVPLVTNYNLLMTPLRGDLEEAEVMARCRRIARQTSARGGGLPQVETMALPHQHGVEVACNLLDLGVTTAEVVRQRVLELAIQEELALDSAYFTNKTADEILSIAEQAA